MNRSKLDAQQAVIKIVQELLIAEEEANLISSAVISGKIDLVVAMEPSWGLGLDRGAVTSELIRRFSLWIGRDSLLTSDAGHEPWLVASRTRDWRYWRRHREWLERKLSVKKVDALDQSTDAVLGLLEDPNREGAWDRRGLVVGHVQSGKTGHYSGLICKAADAGYKIIIVLAGLHNNLRSQTQMRLDEGFLGYETKPVLEDIRVIGVGEIDGDPGIRPNFATNRANAGDFSTAVARNLGITPEQRPWLFVVKKNKTVLNRLLRWVRNHVADHHDQESGRRIVTSLPLLLIDDEADHASVDTGEVVFDSNGIPDEEHQPTAINSLIRQLLYSFSRAAFVGYTATPFANIFIHERGRTRKEGPDLFPASFIVNLAAPSDYVGPASVFGIQAGETTTGAMALVRLIGDHSTEDGKGGWMPPRHVNGHIPIHGKEAMLPPSLVDALHSFLLACAIRVLRGQGNEHSSMLVHVTRFTSVQDCVARQVEEAIRHIRQRLIRRIDHEGLLTDLRALWERDFRPTTRQVAATHPGWAPEDKFGWADIEAALPEVCADVRVRVINGTAKDALDYAEHEGTGLKVIAIGGDKLSRGLTLEGLCVSYFLRASRMYDTLMQMGRWFGYRPGYLDLCRLYTTAELAEWFGHIADASEELREEFDLMVASGGTPREYGLKVQSHPVLMVTSRLKMRSARDLLLSFSGELVETVALFREPEKLSQNVAATRRFLSALGHPAEVDPERSRDGAKQAWKGYLWKSVPAGEVLEFLSEYRTHSEAYKVNSALLGEFIRSMNAVGELTQWTVALIGGGEGAAESLAEGVTVKMLRRANKSWSEDRYSIGRLMSPRDEAINLEDAAWRAALSLTKAGWRGDSGRLQGTAEPDAPNGPAIRRIQGFGADGVAPHRECGVLFLYALDPMLASADFAPSTPPVIALAVSFPASESGLKVHYMGNNVLWERQFGAAE